MLRYKPLHTHAHKHRFAYPLFSKENLLADLGVHIKVPYFIMPYAAIFALEH